MNKEQDICQHSVGMLKSGRAYCRNCGKEYILVDTPLPDKSTEKLTIVPSGRKDYCCECGGVHGYDDCPKDKNTEGWKKEFDKLSIPLDSLGGELWVHPILSTNKAREIIKSFISSLVDKIGNVRYNEGYEDAKKDIREGIPCRMEKKK